MGECVHEQIGGPIATDTLGTRTTIAVNRIADIVVDERGCDPGYAYTGGDRP